MSVSPLPTIVAADHPSLDRAIDRFGSQLRHETRYFGPTAAANPKPYPSLVDGLARSGPAQQDPVRGNSGGVGGGFRLAAVAGREVIALARVDDAGEILVAVAADHRGRGVGTSLVRALIGHARNVGYGRLRMRSCHRSRAVTSLGVSMGFMVVDYGRGRIDLILDLVPAASSA